MKKLFFLLFVVFSTINMFSQEQLSLENCYDFVTKNYPLAKQNALLAKQNELAIEIVKTEKLPKIVADAQATYQSDVTQVPISIPNSTIEPPNKDQYKATVSINQLIYDGGLVDANTKLKNAALKTQQKQLDVSIYQLKKQVNQLYFSILLLQDKRSLLTSKKEQLQTKLKEVKAGVKYGVLLPTSDAILEAELLKISQQFTEIDSNKTSLLNSLSKLIGVTISSSITLQNPTINTDLTSEINRPELALFQLQKEQLETSEQLITKKNTPKIMGFATGGYGNPGLNMLDNSFQPYYMAGVKINWTVFDWNASKKEQKSLLLNKAIIDNQKEIFELNTAIEVQEQESEISKITDFIESDTAIINLRKKVLQSAESQLKNGVITSSAYITELTNLYEAENNLSTHKIQLLLAKSNLNIIKGN